jgi:hypothetical protein
LAVTFKKLCCAALVLCGASSPAFGQDPSREYFTVATPHFRVSFTKPLETIARRVAANAERAYAQLSQDLHPPRGTIEVLVTDDFDFSNGSATPSPSNRIIVYAMPPVTDFGLRYTMFSCRRAACEREIDPSNLSSNSRALAK